jgi:hypothetical protein
VNTTYAEASVVGELKIKRRSRFAGTQKRSLKNAVKKAAFSHRGLCVPPEAELRLIQ